MKCIKDMGIDVVVTDHHEPIPELIPDGIVLNPKVDRKSFRITAARASCSNLYRRLQGLTKR